MTILGTLKTVPVPGRKIVNGPCGALAVLGLAVLAMVPNAAYADGALEKAFSEGEILFDVRYRYEHVGQAGKAKDANASTLRTRFGFKTAEVFNVSVLVEAENVSTLGSKSFNDTINGKTDYPVVADPDNTEVNRAQLTYTGIPDTKVIGGRQRIILDNARFVGNVGWRQNEQTFDSVVIANTSLPDTTFTYAFVGRVNRIFGDDHPAGNLDGNVHVINAAYSGLKNVKVVGYALMIDINDIAALSSQTFGARVSGSFDLGSAMKVAFAAEYASQSEHADNPANFSHDYINIEGTLKYSGAFLGVGYETLGGDGTTAFQTPLATLHKFQGWADAFLVTPAVGIEDLSIKAGYVRKKVGFFDSIKFLAVYHDFSSDVGGMDLGEEWDFLFAAKFAKRFTAILKYADYSGKGFAPSRSKLWLSLQYKY